MSVLRDDGQGIDNNGTEMNIITWTFTSLATFFLLLRVACKLRIRVRLWCDDWVLIASWVVLVASCIVVSVNVADGFGKHTKAMDPKILTTITFRNAVAGTLLTVASSWSKTSFGITLLRITTPRMRLVVWFLMVSMNVFMCTGVIINWTACNPVQALWDFSVKGTCWSMSLVIPLSMLFTGYFGFVDLAFALIACSIVLKLQINLKEKIGVAVAMSLGVFASASAIVKAVSFTTLGDDDYNYNGIELVGRSVAEISTTIIAASIPVLRTLVCDIDWPTLRYGSRRSVVGVRYVRPTIRCRDRSANNHAGMYRMRVDSEAEEISGLEITMEETPMGHVSKKKTLAYPDKCVTGRGGKEDGLEGGKNRGNGEIDGVELGEMQKKNSSQSAWV
ncbi:hypothetical protein M426DRAFT_16578 [Hypoxylon sp. CI-4A]|nr:hypothetical protein M426DRAFT_16578 [Hypoxylon sp. CI-4A]